MLFHFIVSDQVKNWQVNRRKTNRIFDYIIEEYVGDETNSVCR